MTGSIVAAGGGYAPASVVDDLEETHNIEPICNARKRDGRPCTALARWWSECHGCGVICYACHFHRAEEMEIAARYHQTLCSLCNADITNEKWKPL